MENIYTNELRKMVLWIGQNTVMEVAPLYMTVR